MSLAVLRRYTPPTCTLEILGKQSVLSRWASQPVLKDVRFKLNLDDPKLPDDQWVSLQGDRTQLEALSGVIQDYVQNLLEKPQSNGSATATISVLPQVSDRQGVAIAPKGLLAHELTLGTLGTPEKPSIQLSTLQLFDLANAIDEYSNDVLTLPSNWSRPQWLKTAPQWGPVAAGLVVLVGFSASVVNMFGRNPATTTAGSQGASSADQRIATQLPPQAMPKAAKSNQPLTPPLLPNAGKPGSMQGGMPNVGVSGATGQPGFVMGDSGATGANPGSANASGAAKTGQAATGQPAAGTGDDMRVASGNVPVNPGQPMIIQAEGASESSSASPSPNPPAQPSTPSEGIDQIGNTGALDSARARPSASGEVQPPPAAVAPPAPAPPPTVPNPVAQVGEVREYFRKQWKPPAGLTGNLQYQLEINSSGEITRATPIGQPAIDNVEKTNIPLNDPIFSPLENGVTVRLLLNADGSVDAFQE